MLLMRVPRAFVAPLAALLIAVGPLGGLAATADPQAELHQMICRMVDGAAAANRLPAAYLARILWQESRLRSDATSPVGAEGVAQFMPRTASERGLADPRDPAPSIAAAARMLADLNARFGNRGLAAAAYNAGAGRVEKWLHKQSDLPAETRHYVVAVTRRPVEEWASSTGADQIAGGDGEPCLAVLSGLARSAPGRTLAGKWQALDRALARAVGLLAALPHERRPRPGDSPAVEALCDSIRSLGARCAVHYQP
jgi:hypothetical protein